MTDLTCPARHFLWHLAAITTGSASCDPVTPDFSKLQGLWGKADKNPQLITVAIIDTGIDTGHPNLENAVCEQIDFGPDIAGVVYEAPKMTSFSHMRRVLEGREAGKLDIALVKAAAEEMRAATSTHYIDLDTLQAVIDAGTTGAEASIKGASSEDPAVLARLLIDATGAAGARPDPMPGQRHIGAGSQSIEAMSAFSKELSDDTLKKIWTDFLADLEAPPIPIATRDPNRFFGAHGTACAGLVGGRPSCTKTDGPGQSPLPYAGVNRYCRIRSYATPYSYEILPVIAALVRAYASGSEVILMPRGLPNPGQRANDMESSPYRTRIDTKSSNAHLRPGDYANHETLSRHWQLLITLMRFVARERYLVLAAGNDAFKNCLSEPAQSLKDDPNVIIVGARNARGCLSSYTNEGPDVFYMLSDDAFALDKNHYAVDERSFSGSDYDYGTIIGKGADNTFSGWGILTIDVRGSYGYAAGSREDPPTEDDGLDARGLYTIFGGTSAASSLMAGLISLLMQAEELCPGCNRDELKEKISNYYVLV
ncbi:S8 family serine peptidase [bacterium]|nr:S8 family serine peptidase [bacterium]